MGVAISLDQLGIKAWQRAKRTFALEWVEVNKPEKGNKRQFWIDFGTANNMHVIIDEYKGNYPVVKNVVFNTDEDLVIFKLKWL